MSPTDQIPHMQLPAAYVKLFLQHAQAQGLSLPRLLAGTTLQAEALWQADGPVDFDDVLRVLGNVTAAVGRGWHLDLADRLATSAHGPLGFAVVTARNLRAAVDVLLRFIGIRGPYVWASGAQEKDDFVLRLFEATDMADQRETLIELTLLSVQGMLERPLGHEIHGARIAFAYPPPPYRERLEGTFHAQLRFGAGGHQLRFPARLLDEPCGLSDAEMHRYLLSRCEEELRVAAGTLPAEVAVRQALLAQPGEFPRLEAIAAAQHVSPRTLIRRLRQGGTSYKSILENVRRTLARDYLLHSDMTVAAIAFRLGYQDPSNFGRAFRGWYGTSPRRYRMLLRKRAGGLAAS